MYMSFQLLCALMLALFHSWRIPLSQEMQHTMLLLWLHELFLLVPHHQVIRADKWSICSQLHVCCD